MMMIDRASFIAWTEGVLLDRKADGTFVCGDNVVNEAAELALERGETVGLTIGGRLVSTVKHDADQGAYVEEAANER